MIYTENRRKIFSAGSFLTRPANFSVLSNDRKRPALISPLKVADFTSASFPSCLQVFVIMINNESKLPASIAGAYEHLAEFFDQYNLPESKAMLWKFFTATVTGHFEELTVIEKENIVTFFERMNNLLEVIHTIHHAQSQAEK